MSILELNFIVDKRVSAIDMNLTSKKKAIIHYLRFLLNTAMSALNLRRTGGTNSNLKSGGLLQTLQKAQTNNRAKNTLARTGGNVLANLGGGKRHFILSNWCVTLEPQVQMLLCSCYLRTTSSNVTLLVLP